MKVIIKNPHEMPRIEDIECSRRALQKAVDGYILIEGSRYHAGNFVVNETPHFCGCEKNCEVEGRTYFGPIVFIGVLAGNFQSAPVSALKLLEQKQQDGTLSTEEWLWK